jgi:NF-X1-type zinc finger protein NFXL1
LTDVYYRCCDLNKNGLGEEEKKKIMEKMFSCGNRCIKNVSNFNLTFLEIVDLPKFLFQYPCNHRCTSNCHSGPCPDSESCKKKVKIFCKCKTRKFEINCDKIRRDNLEFIDCDEICEEKRQKEIQLKLEQKMEQERLEKEKNQRELEEFEKKFGRKKTRERKVREVEEKSDNKLMIIGASVSGLVVVLAFVLYFTIFTN